MLCAACSVILLPACSDPTPALTAEQFHEQAGAIREQHFGRGENAWPMLLDALEAHSALMDSVDEPFSDGIDPSDYPSIQIDEIRLGAYPRPGLENAKLAIERARRSDILERIDAALASPVLYRPWDESLPVYEAFGEDLMDGGRIRSLARTNLALLRVAACEDSGEDVAAIFDRHLGLARAVASRLLYLDYLMGVANATMALSEIKSLALEHRLTAAECRALDARLERPILPPVAAVLDTERLFSLATFADAAAAEGTRIDREAMIRAIDAAHAEASASIEDPYGASFGVLSFADHIAAATDEQSSQAESIGLMRSAAGQVIRNAKILELQAAATSVVLRLELHRLEHGDYPDSLEAIAAPLDPITEAPFIYRPTPGGELPYALYSTGVDDADDGGREKPATGLAYADPGDIGYDFLLVKPRAPATRE